MEVVKRSKKQHPIISNNALVEIVEAKDGKEANVIMNKIDQGKVSLLLQIDTKVIGNVALMVLPYENKEDMPPVRFFQEIRRSEHTADGDLFLIVSHKSVILPS